MFLKKTLYELPMKRDYVSHWGFIEAVRELFQNAIDGGSGWTWKLEPHPSESGNLEDHFWALTISSPNVSLPVSTLVLGESSKRGDSHSIGAFGEGFKLALLVLAREGVPVTMLNDDVAWEPRFTQSVTFDTEVFAIQETRCPEHKDKGLEYVISGLTLGHIGALQDAFLFMRDDWKEETTPAANVYFTTKGRIFLEDQPAIYVSGLFICQTKLKYSYDFKPEVLRLERDRQTVPDFELQWVTKDMWLETCMWDHIAKMIEKEDPDVEYIHYNCPELLKEAVYKQFLANNPKGIMARSMEQMQELVKKGMEKVVYVGGAYGSIVCSAQPPRIRDTLKLQSPEDILNEFFSENRKYMRTPAIVNFKSLINRSKLWRGS